MILVDRNFQKLINRICSVVGTVPSLHCVAIDSLARRYNPRESDSVSELARCDESPRLALADKLAAVTDKPSADCGACEIHSSFSFKAVV